VFRLKLAQLHTLVKLTVVDGDRRLARPTQHRHDNCYQDNNNNTTTSTR